MSTEKNEIIMHPNIRNNSSLDETGAEVLDPVPYSTTIGFKAGETIETRIKAMLDKAYLQAYPDHGLDSDDDDDFDVPTDDPMYGFERQYEEIDAIRAELAQAEEELEASKAEYAAHRKANPGPIEPELKEEPKPPKNKAKKSVPSELDEND